MSDEVDPVTRARQLACKHDFIRPHGNVERCVHCGISRAEWEQIEAQQSVAHLGFCP